MARLAFARMQRSTAVVWAHGRPIGALLARIGQRGQTPSHRANSSHKEWRNRRFWRFESQESRSGARVRRDTSPLLLCVSWRRPALSTWQVKFANGSHGLVPPSPVAARLRVAPRQCVDVGDGCASLCGVVVSYYLQSRGKIGRSSMRLVSAGSVRETTGRQHKAIAAHLHDSVATTTATLLWYVRPQAPALLSCWRTRPTAIVVDVLTWLMLAFREFHVYSTALTPISSRA